MEREMTAAQAAFFASVNVNIAILEMLHSGIAIFDRHAKLQFANATYKKMYQLDDNCIGLDAVEFFLTARQGILEVLKTGESNSCASVTINGLYGVTYRWPLWDREGRVAGCMTENISVSPMKDKIHEMQNIIDELEHYNSFCTTLCPRHSTETVSFDSIVGESSAMRLLKEKGKRFAQNNEPILILGENGTGKDLVAQAVHAASSRHAQNFVAVNCAAIPHELMESELFGYEAGAFTGAKSSGKKGQFELADGGTLFLDEIGEMPLTLQAKLLRVLENHQIKKLGATHAQYVDFRLVSATNRNLEQMVQQGRFREDLYYRLNLFDLVVPPLRERIADIPLLSYSILSGLLGPERTKNIRISKEVLSVCSTHPWRGNVRELRNILTYALYSMKDSETELCLRHLPDRFFHKTDNEFLSNTLEDGGKGDGVQDADERPASLYDMQYDAPHDASVCVPESLLESRQEAERKSILEALKKCGGSKVKAARMLGIARSGLYRKMTALGLN